MTSKSELKRRFTTSPPEVIERVVRLETELTKARDAIRELLPAAVWMLEGPYGPSPSENCLKLGREVLVSIDESGLLK